jgi:DNA polymerase (family 10)
MNKFEVARVLDEIAKYVELSEANRFKSLAFEKASRGRAAEDARHRENDGRRRRGSSAPANRDTSRSCANNPPGIFELLRVPQLGLKKVGILHDKLGIGSLDELEAACKAGRLKTLRGFGEKTEQKILQGIAYARKRESNFLLPVGLEIGEQIRERLADIDAVDNAEVSGSVRRRLEIIRNVNIAVATRDAKAVTKALAKVVANIEVLDPNTVEGMARNEVEVYFHLCKPQEFGSTLLRTTGSPEFVAALLERDRVSAEERKPEGRS